VNHNTQKIVKSFNLTTHTHPTTVSKHTRHKRSRSEQGVFVHLQTTVDFDRAGVLRKAETAHFLCDIHILKASAHASGLGEQLDPGRSVVLHIQKNTVCSGEQACVCYCRLKSLGNKDSSPV